MLRSRLGAWVTQRAIWLLWELPTESLQRDEAGVTAINTALLMQDMRKELGVPEKIDVSLVHAVRAEELMNRAFDVSALCGTSTKDQIVIGAECAEHIFDILRHKRKVDHCVQTELSHYLLHKSGMSVGDWSGRQQWLSKVAWGGGVRAPPKGGLALPELSQERQPEPLLVAGPPLADSMSFSAGITACDLAGRWEMGVQLFSRMHCERILRDVLAFNAVLSSVARVGQWEPVLMLLQEMCSAEVTPDAFSRSAAISACAAGGRWEVALKELQRPGSSANTAVFNAAMSALQRAGLWQRVLELLMDLPKKNLEADSISFNVAISACEGAGMWQGALELLKKMSRAELRRNEITWNAAVRALQQGTQWQLALDLLAQATPKGKKGAADAEVMILSLAFATSEQGGHSVAAQHLLQLAESVDVRDLLRLWLREEDG
ncbi:Pentatricopeptide repeat-containing protein, chloroplastic [Symbiodinium microadriaticum]|uniref:Pentatricopeptide repeat-containing protein, chloroplastic n=1 Tax=Symbiodinium microadriaticum TaxID=2951 RepID=A0A1Q9DF77_SYMMI|nr:Pentatricopeptide repeat-containing protein, chloroplastic [Symbiodinium microadriaticum]